MKHYYIVHIQFLGFRFHGWQKQPDQSTVQGTIEKAIEKLFPEKNARLFGGSRTDSMVSALHYVFQLTLENESIDEAESFIEKFNWYLPPDIKALKIETVLRGFNIIQSPKLKEYHYYFSYGGEKPHPFSAPMLCHIRGELDLSLMKLGAQKFMGTHNFKKYCYKPQPDKNFERTIEHCEILENDIYTANFFPKETFYLKVVGHSFIRHQVRLMAGTLFKLGLHEITFEEFEDSLLGKDFNLIGFMAPASGLVLHEITTGL